MLNVSENVNLNATITENDVNGVSIPIVDVYANLNKNTNELNLGFRVINTESGQQLLTTQSADIQSQFASFLDTVNSKMIEYGYKITLK